MDVLKTKSQIDEARNALAKMGVSSLAGVLPRILRRLRLSNRVIFSDRTKSWDVLKTLEFLNTNISKTDAVLDIGCYASEVLICLKKMDFQNLAGVDLNPHINSMPFNDTIKYVVSDFMKTPFKDGTFKAITSISVIEHGLDIEGLMKEVSRLLKPGGYFVASFDYWPEKINTAGIKFFDMDWTIFSVDEVNKLCAIAGRYGLMPQGSLNPPVKDRTIHCATKDYTFAWIVFQKTK